MSILTTLFLLLPVLVFAVAFPLLIGIYVYRDARRRCMNAALWTLIAVIAPAFIGLIIYLIARGNYADLICPACAAPVAEQFLVCPRCGVRLKRSCPACGIAAEEGWQVCPACATSLAGTEGGVTPPVRRRDKALGRILAALLAIPFLLLLCVILFSFTSYTGHSASMSTGTLALREYADNPEISGWLADCDPAFDGLYALSYRQERQELKTTAYLIYDPSAKVNFETHTVFQDSLFGNYISLTLTANPLLQVEELQPLTTLVYQSDAYVGLRVTVDGQEKDVQLTEVSFDPTG